MIPSCLKIVLCILLLFMVASCGQRPPPPQSGVLAPQDPSAASVEMLIKSHAELEQQLSAEKELRQKMEHQLSLEQSWRAHWQRMTFICAGGALLALLIGMGLGSTTRKEVEPSP